MSRDGTVVSSTEIVIDRFRFIFSLNQAGGILFEKQCLTAEDTSDQFRKPENHDRDMELGSK